MMRLIRRFLASTSGAAAAELALMLPLLTVLMFGGMEMGGYLWAEHQVLKSVRSGARFAGRQDFANFACDATDVGGADTAVRNMIRTGTTDGSGDPVVRTWLSNDEGISISVVCQPDADYGTSGIYADLSGLDTPTIESARYVAVKVELPYPSFFADLGYLNGRDIVASAQSPVVGF